MAAKKRSPKRATAAALAALVEPTALRVAVDELLALERQLVAADEVLAQQKADHSAATKALKRRRSEVLAELNGEGRQTRLTFNPDTGEVNP